MSRKLEQPYGPHAGTYRSFFELASQHKGYHFGENHGQPVPPPKITFSHPLRWWSWDRPKRLKIIQQLRDQRLIEILKLGEGNTNFSRGKESDNKQLHTRKEGTVAKHIPSPPESFKRIQHVRVLCQRAA